VTFKPLLITGRLSEALKASALPPEKGKKDGTRSPVRSPGQTAVGLPKVVGQGEVERTKGAVKTGPAPPAAGGRPALWRG